MTAIARGSPANFGDGPNDGIHRVKMFGSEY